MKSPTWGAVVAELVNKFFASNETRNFTEPYPQPGEFTFSFIIHFRGVRKLAKSGRQRRHVCLSIRLSAWHNSAPTGRIFMKWCIFRKCVEKIQVSIKSAGILHEALHIFTIACRILLKKRNVSYKSCRDNQNTAYPQYFFNRATYVIMEKNIVQPGWPQMTI
jgi:hypothetical protein